MDFQSQFQTEFKNLALRGSSLAEDLEAGQAATPFGDAFRQLNDASGGRVVKAVVLGMDADATNAALSCLLGQDYNLCKVCMPSRLGYSEISLQERGFLLEDGDQKLEFDDVEAFASAIQESNGPSAQERVNWMDPVRLKMKAPAHLSGLCLLVPDSLESIAEKPALLSTLADQTDWAFIAGYPDRDFSADQVTHVQLILDQVVGFQGLLIPSMERESGDSVAWWKRFRAGLSLGAVNTESDLLPRRLAMLTHRQSELRQYILESRGAGDFKTHLRLLKDTLDQQEKQLAGKRRIIEGNAEDGVQERGSTRKQGDPLRNRLKEDSESIKSAVERDTKRDLSPEGALHQPLKQAADAFSEADIEQTISGSKIKLGVNAETRTSYGTLLAQLATKQIEEDQQLFQEGLTSTRESVETELEAITGFRTQLNLEPLDMRELRDSVEALASPEIQYRGEMDRPTLMKRFQSARSGIMGLMMVGMIGTGFAALSGDSEAGGGDFRTMLYVA
ncbi:MAG: hypothetical protein ACPGN3_03660 [Opitutales bacterium]